MGDVRIVMLSRALAVPVEQLAATRALLGNDVSFAAALAAVWEAAVGLLPHAAPGPRSCHRSEAFV